MVATEDVVICAELLTPDRVPVTAQERESKNKSRLQQTLAHAGKRMRLPARTVPLFWQQRYLLAKLSCMLSLNAADGLEWLPSLS